MRKQNLSMGKDDGAHRFRKRHKVAIPDKTQTLVKLALTPTIGPALRMEAINLLIPIAIGRPRQEEMKKVDEAASRQAISALCQVAPFLDGVIERPRSAQLLRRATKLRAHVKDVFAC
jgi:hypothetical protein